MVFATGRQTSNDLLTRASSRNSRWNGHMLETEHGHPAITLWQYGFLVFCVKSDSCCVILTINLSRLHRLINWNCNMLCLDYRRNFRTRSNNAANTSVANTPDSYEIASDSNSRHTYLAAAHDQSETSAPAVDAAARYESRNTTMTTMQPSSLPPRSSPYDATLVDNDLYQ